MAGKIEFKADTTDLQKMNSYFSGNDWKAVKRRALQEGATKIKKAARYSFKEQLPNATKRSKKYKDRLIDAIRSTKITDKGLADMSIGVHTLGTRKSGSGTFRARFFEGGTKVRTQGPYVDSLGRKYVHSRKVGSIKPLHFFTDSVKDANVAEMDMVKMLSQQVEKINNKKY